MTQMPQMVALYNGVGGGAAALISWSEFRYATTGVGAGIPLEIFVPILLDRDRLRFVLGLEHRLRQLQDLGAQPPIQLPFQHIFNGALLAAILAGRIVLGIDHDLASQALLHRRPDRGRGARQPLRAPDRRGGHAGGDLAA